MDGPVPPRPVETPGTKTKSPSFVLGLRLTKEVFMRVEEGVRQILSNHVGLDVSGKANKLSVELIHVHIFNMFSSIRSSYVSYEEFKRREYVSRDRAHMYSIRILGVSIAIGWQS